VATTELRRPRISLGTTGLLRYRMPSSDTNAKAVPTNRRGTEKVGNDVWYHDASGPRRQPTIGHRASQRAEQPVCVSEQELADGPPFGIVGIELPLVGKIAPNQSDPPSQVPRVLDAGVHALPTDRAVNVRRVAGEEHVAVTIGCSLPMVKMNPREAGRIAETNDIRARRTKSDKRHEKGTSSNQVTRISGDTVRFGTSPGSFF
jgi:hypothetical protein